MKTSCQYKILKIIFLYCRQCYQHGGAQELRKDRTAFENYLLYTRAPLARKAHTVNSVFGLGKRKMGFALPRYRQVVNGSG